MGTTHPSASAHTHYSVILGQTDITNRIRENPAEISLVVDFLFLGGIFRCTLLYIGIWGLYIHISMLYTMSMCVIYVCVIYVSVTAPL
jgi:hypothetical protein